MSDSKKSIPPHRIMGGVDEQEHHRQGNRNSSHELDTPLFGPRQGFRFHSPAEDGGSWESGFPWLPSEAWFQISRLSLTGYGYVNRQPSPDEGLLPAMGCDNSIDLFRQFPR